MYLSQRKLLTKKEAGVPFTESPDLLVVHELVFSSVSIGSTRAASNATSMRYAKGVHVRLHLRRRGYYHPPAIVVCVTVKASKSTCGRPEVPSTTISMV